MNDRDKLLFARNELENVIANLQNTLQMSHHDMMLVIEMLLSTARYKVITQSAYDTIKPLKKEKAKQGENEEVK